METNKTTFIQTVTLTATSNFDKRFYWNEAAFSAQTTYTVHIDNIKLTDSGEYECVFANDKGIAIKNISIHVVDDPYVDILGPGEDPFTGCINIYSR